MTDLGKMVGAVLGGAILTKSAFVTMDTIEAMTKKKKKKCGCGGLL